MNHKLILLSSTAVLASQAYAKTPNVVFIMADDLGYNHLSVYGQKRMQTPHIDSMAKKGLRFLNAYSGSTVCGPSRSSLMTGLHGGHIPYKSNPGFADLDPDNITIGEIFKKQGYNTGYFGKWGLGGQNSGITPNDLGYDKFLGILDQGHGHRHYPAYIIDNGKKKPLNKTAANGNTSLNKEDRKVHTHDAFTEGALNFISKAGKDKKSPFFCFVSFTLPHTEIIATDKEANEFIDLGWKEDYTARTSLHFPQNKPRSHFAGMIRMVDNSVGALVQKIEKMNLANDTLIIFTSDNGGQLKQVWGNAPSVWFDANGILRGGKQELYEGGIRVPMLAYWKGKTPVNKTTVHQCYFADILPTFCNLLRTETPEKTDGISILPTLLGRTNQKKHDFLFWSDNNRKFAVLKNNWKAVKFGKKPVEIYNLKEDPSEKKNIASQKPELAKAMEKIIKAEAMPDSKKARPSKNSPRYPKEK